MLLKIFCLESHHNVKLKISIQKCYDTLFEARFESMAIAWYLFYHWNTNLVSFGIIKTIVITFEKRNSQIVLIFWPSSKWNIEKWTGGHLAFKQALIKILQRCCRGPRADSTLPGVFETLTRCQGSICRGWLRVWSPFNFAEFGRIWSLFAKNSPKSWKINVFAEKMTIFQNFRFCPPPPWGSPLSNRSLLGNFYYILKKDLFSKMPSDGFENSIKFSEKSIFWISNL